MDAFDTAILDIIQSDAGLSHEAIGQRVNLSASSVRRRITNLKRDGVIERDVSIVNVEQFGVLLITSVILNEETPEIYNELDTIFAEQKLVKQSYHVSGESDYIIIVHASSMQSYEEWARAVLMSNAYINRFNTTVVYSRRKFDTSVTTR
ncbi:Lrp/AsnC family transcriptional regulator [Algimonas porphyrae]|uniref:AsnC family transcriptional regulator n=1 Tax=Algimonas porphyrae TaxID=1128113 RepID=A0ABQ5V4K3_9PROT|nr:Lrp/AsnC family transcriptional regulator [Algimonas porphyrae]GLQ21917.1 AsnC family transcriptional regulator [Algimonas porphyrae]